MQLWLERVVFNKKPLKIVGGLTIRTNNNDMKTKPVTIKIPENLDKLLDQISSETDIDKSVLVNGAIQQTPDFELSDKITRCYKLDSEILEKLDSETGKNRATYIMYAVIDFLLRKKLL